MPEVANRLHLLVEHHLRIGHFYLAPEQDSYNCAVLVGKRGATAYADSAAGGSDKQVVDRYVRQLGTCFAFNQR